MQPRTIILFVVLFFAVIAGMFTFAYLKKSELATSPEGSLPEEVSTSTLPYMEQVDVKQYYIDGVHTFAGVIDMPTPCHLLEADTVVRESMPEQISIDFTVINNADMCAQVITPQRFMVSASASEAAVISATWDGVPIGINLIPAAEGETPEEFELFIKG